MRKILSSILTLLAAVAITGICFASCESQAVDQDVDLSTYEAVKAQVVDSDGNCRFPGCGGSGITAVGCPSQEMAEGFVSALTLGEYQGEPLTVLEMGKYGYVASRYISDEDRYFNLEVRISGYDTMRLMLVSEAYFMNLNPNNGSEGDESIDTTYRCLRCGAAYAYVPDFCPVCGEPSPEFLPLQPLPVFTMDETTVDFSMEVNQ